MPSLVLGRGTGAIRIDGDVLRVDSLSTAVEEKKGAKDAGRGSSVVRPLIPSGPGDNILLSQLPKAVREIAECIAQTMVIKLSYDIKRFSFFQYDEEVDAWTDFTHPSRGIAGFSVSNRELAFSGLVPLGRQGKVGELLTCNGFILGVVVDRSTALLTPWAVRCE